MADNKVYGVKVPDELFQEASRLQKEFNTGEEFLNALLSSFKFDKAKGKIPEIAEDFKELQALSLRIDNIYLNLAYRIQNISKIKDDEMMDKLQKKDSIIMSLQNNVDNLTTDKDTLTTAFNNAMEDKATLEKQVNQLTETNISNKELIEEYKNKIDMLTGMLSKYEKYPEEVERLKTALSGAQRGALENENLLNIKDQNINTLKDKVNDLTLSIENIKEQGKKEKEVLIIQHIAEVEELKSRHNTDIERAVQDVSRAKDAEKREVILQLKEEQQEKIQAVQNEYIGKISVYQEKYEKLLRELEELRAAQKNIK
jgi:chromosome segregation ATPase